jgi:hypothetical protein
MRVCITLTDFGEPLFSYILVQEDYICVIIPFCFLNSSNLLFWLTSAVKFLIVIRNVDFLGGLGVASKSMNCLLFLVMDLE